MADNLRLRVVLDFVDRALGPLKRVSEGSRDAARALKAAKESLKALNAQQAQVGEFRTLKGELHDTAAKLALARGRVGELARMYGQTAEPTRAMTRELEKAKREAAALGILDVRRFQARARELRLECEVLPDGAAHRALHDAGERR